MTTRTDEMELASCLSQNRKIPMDDALKLVKDFAKSESSKKVRGIASTLEDRYNSDSRITVGEVVKALRTTASYLVSS